ncbi:MAG: amidohydrolase family protein [Erythrobacter sp.]
MTEEILEPDLPIIDPHHHLWDLRSGIALFPEPRHSFIDGLIDNAYYTFDQLHAHLTSGHNIIGTAFMECGAFYNAAYGPEKAPVGEIEYVNGLAAQSASGIYGDLRACAAIVGHADLTMGSAVGEVLDALHAAAPNRYRGIRHQGAWDADVEVLSAILQKSEGLYLEPSFREGFAELGKRGHTFDAWILEPQLPDVIDLANAFPNQKICLDHCGTPLGLASYQGKLPERFDIWRANIHELAKSENVVVKLGGLAMAMCGMPEGGRKDGYSSQQLADLWRPYIETCIEAFGPDRAMFESNYPVDYWGADYAVLWNTFKRITNGASAAEKSALFAGSAAKFYQIEDILP